MPLHEEAHLPQVITENGRVKIISNTGGVGVYQNQTTYDKTLAAILSGLALIKNRPYVPTNEQPQNQFDLGGYNPYAVNPYAVSNVDLQNTAGGKVETWVKENTGVVMIAGAVLAAYLLKSPVKSR